MKIYKPEEIEEIYTNIKKRVVAGDNLSKACKACGYSYTIMNSDKMYIHKIELKQIIASRNKKKTEYVIPQRSPFKKESKPLLREDNYLV